jgi:hypothetical protein
MRSLACLRLAACLAATSVAVACSDSTGPTPLTAAQIAAHFDSLAVQAIAQSDTNSAFGTRGLVTTLIELPAALGALPATVSVTTANGVESWKAYEILAITAPGATTDSSFAVLMFRDADAHTALIAFFDSTGTINEGGLITGDTIAVNPIDHNGSTSLTSVSTACATPSTSLVNPQLGFIGIGDCTLAQFHTSLDLTLPTTSGLDAALTTISFSNATMNGVREVDQAEGAAIRRVHEMLRAAKASKRH